MDAFSVASRVEKIKFPVASLLSDSKFDNIKFEATNIPNKEPIGLKACARLSLRVAVLTSPIDRINGLAVVSKKAKPKVKMPKG